MTSIKFRALTQDDYRLFFEALGEYGKDFQNIQQYMIQKGNKNKSEQNNNNKSNDQQDKRDQDKKEEDKKRDQIRNFYNKLYARLSQLIGKLDDRVEKVNQELYLLINYGEIWKKHGFMFNNKTKRLLEDLLYQGSTTLRFKTKNVRLRTPSCRALKKINEIGVDERVKVVTTRELPKDVIVEFYPATNRDWLKVQSISQNPRVRARLSIQKRLSNILDFLEKKWNISPDKMNRTIDNWLKLDPKSQQSSNLEDLIAQQQQQISNPPTYADGTTTNLCSNNNNLYNTNNHHRLINSVPPTNNDGCVSIHERLRLKPSDHHELKDVNIIRVVPDNHLDLSLTAYINHLNDTTKPPNHGPSQAKSNIGHTDNQNLTESDPAKLPVSLTTPDCSILFEKSCTSDQPSIAQARKHLNLLQSLTGALDGCENSRTACEDTQDRSLHSMINHINSMNQVTSDHSRSVGFASHPDGSHHGSNRVVATAPIALINNDIPALYDEDAALPVDTPNQPVIDTTASRQFDREAGSSLKPSNFYSHNSKSVDFSLPKNVTLGDYFKMTNETIAGDQVIASDETANDAFTISIDQVEKPEDPVVNEIIEDFQLESPKDSLIGTQNHLIDIKRVAEGWTKVDDASMTIGELYLALRCPEKIVLEYAFERFTYEGDNAQQESSSDNISHRDDPSGLNIRQICEKQPDDRLIFKLLTAASLSLAQIERLKNEQQIKIHEQQSCSKLKRRKLGLGQVQNAMTPHDIEATNQRVEEALKQLQPTRLCSYKRAR